MRNRLNSFSLCIGMWWSIQRPIKFIYDIKSTLDDIAGQDKEEQQMNCLTTFNAPWGTSLKVTTGLSILILAGIIAIGIFTGPHNNSLWIFGMIALPLSMLFIASLFTIRGYVLTPEALLIRRLGWNSRVGLSGLQSAEVDAEAMSQSTRTFGNGGMFCIAGAFNNNKLGSYRAFVTDPKRSVVLRFSDRTVVVTPDQPDGFVGRIRELTTLWIHLSTITCSLGLPADGQNETGV